MRWRSGKSSSSSTKARRGAGSVAEAVYGVPEVLWQGAERYLTEELADIVARFYRPSERGCFLLALTFADLLQPAGGDPEEAFAGGHEKAGRLCGGSPQNRPAGGKGAPNRLRPPGSAGTDG